LHDGGKLLRRHRCLLAKLLLLIKWHVDFRWCLWGLSFPQKIDLTILRPS
jgi:hypothetical protein